MLVLKIAHPASASKRITVHFAAHQSVLISMGPALALALAPGPKLRDKERVQGPAAQQTDLHYKTKPQTSVLH